MLEHRAFDEKSGRASGTRSVARDRRGPLSILHVYSGNLLGGIETLLATLAHCRQLEPMLRMEFALCFPGRLRDQLRSAGAQVHDLGEVRYRFPWTVRDARRRLARLLSDRRFDFVVTHSCWPHAVFAPTARRAGRRLVFWQHDLVDGSHWIERIAGRNPPDMVVSNSRASAETLPRLFPGVETEVVRYPVAASSPPDNAAGSRSAIRRELDTPEDAVVMIQACRLEHWKGHTLLIESLGGLIDRSDWVAWIVGGAQRPHEHRYLARLKAQAASAGVAVRIRFVGQRTDVARLLAAADIQCQPNIGPEPFGIAFIEALHAGLPVVATRMGGPAEIITEDCGVLVDPGDVAMLTGSLRRLIADPSERSRLGAGGPARASALCDPEQSLHRLFDVLARLDARHPAAPCLNEQYFHTIK